MQLSELIELLEELQVSESNFDIKAGHLSMAWAGYDQTTHAVSINIARHKDLCVVFQAPYSLIGQSYRRKINNENN